MVRLSESSPFLALTHTHTHVQPLTYLLTPTRPEPTYLPKKKQHAHAAELLLPYLRGRPGGARVLDVGAGSGYLTSVLYQLAAGADGAAHPGSTETGAGTGAVVVGIEHIPALSTLAERNIRADGLGDAIDKQGIVLVTGDGRLGTSAKSGKKYHREVLK
jgi:protein-L-isoaspartate(D-aspartate) O-methyltransferase